MMDSEPVELRDERDVGILGSGVASLCLASSLAKDGFSVAVVDQALLTDTEGSSSELEIPIAAHASTRNQGWLQSGALYRAYNQPQVPEACRDGFKSICDLVERVAPVALRDDVPAYFLFSDEEDLVGQLGW